MSALGVDHANMRAALEMCVSALDGLLGDSDLPEADRPGVLAMKAARAALQGAPSGYRPVETSEE